MERVEIGRTADPQLGSGTSWTSPSTAVRDAETARGAHARMRRPGTIALGLILLLAVGVLASAVLPRPQLEAWLLIVVAVLGLSVVLLIMALLPRRIGGGDSAQDATDPTPGPVAADSSPSVL